MIEMAVYQKTYHSMCHGQVVRNQYNLYTKREKPSEPQLML